LTTVAEPKVHPRRLYVDTSAYLCLLLAQAGWKQLAKEMAGAQLLSSVLLVIETKRNLVRLVRAGHLNADQYEAAIGRLDQDLSLFLLRDLTLELCQSNTMPVVATPRTLDLVHLRTALWFHAATPLDRFVSMDAAQQQAAKELGLPA
jgi:hypothetical protein